MISIVGGGYIGGYLGYLLAKKNMDVTVYEEHSQIGKPYRDTGIVTSALNEIIPVKNNLIFNKVHKVQVFVKNEMLELDLPEEYVLDRIGFSQYLMNKALDLGAKLELGHRYLGCEESIDKLKLEFSRKTVNTDYLIGADGAFSTVARSTGLHINSDFLMGMEARAKLEMDEDAFEVYPSFVNDFFGWVVPEGDGIVRIGLATKNNVKTYYDNFLRKRGVKKVMSKNGGAILNYQRNSNLNNKRVFLAGDAANLVKSTTGGGILTGMIGADVLVDSIVDGGSYKKNIRKRLGKDLFGHLFIRKTLNKFSEEDYLKLIKLLKQDKVKTFLSGIERDYPSKFSLGLILKEPRLLRFATKIF